MQINLTQQGKYNTSVTNTTSKVPKGMIAILFLLGDSENILHMVGILTVVLNIFRLFLSSARTLPQAIEGTLRGWPESSSSKTLSFYIVSIRKNYRTVGQFF